MDHVFWVGRSRSTRWSRSSSFMSGPSKKRGWDAVARLLVPVLIVLMQLKFSTCQAKTLQCQNLAFSSANFFSQNIFQYPAMLPQRTARISTRTGPLAVLEDRVQRKFRHHDVKHRWHSVTQVSWRGEASLDSISISVFHGSPK